ncbi:MAG: 4-hydroxybenzoate octaprenyltransferase [Neomegalonema sp.]|nr:4-hydroxybenzoate octaprenyltransferase [Neomegalonema sp.]
MSGFDGFETAADGSPVARPSRTEKEASGRVADAPANNWVDSDAPNRLQPYLRLARFDRPIGAWLLLLPGWQGIALAGGAYSWDARNLETFGWLAVAWLVVAFLIGAFVMRGAGCVLNDIVDRKIDRQVERTRSRPLASGAVKPWQALIELTLLCAIGLAILSTMNDFAILVGVASLLPVMIYPFMKRITFFPQFFLGIAFSWGALLGWAAIAGKLGVAPALLYVGGIAWIMGYDTIYAHQDREDDSLIGVKSTALFFGEASRVAVAVFYGLAVILAGAAGIVAGLSGWFWLGLACYAAHLGLQALRLDIHNPGLCLALFKSNREAGLLLLGGIILGGL